MKYTDYHKNILMDPKESSHQMVVKSLEYIDKFEESIFSVIKYGDWDKYIENITDYDKFLWECHHRHPQKTNPINILQNKKYSSYRETMLLPLWVRISNSINFKTNLLINKSVTQTIYDDGTFNMKDVDGGLGIEEYVNGEKILLPILTNEDKGGHFCKTTASNVNGINYKFKELNSNIITISTTDNQVTIGKNIDGTLLQHTNLLASIRLENLKHKQYCQLNPNIFKNLEKIIVKKLNQIGKYGFSLENYVITKKNNKTIREQIDSNGLFLNI